MHARRRFLRIASTAALAAAAAPLAAPALAADSWPNRPIRLVVPYPPAGRRTSSPA